MNELPTLDLRRFAGPDRAAFLAELRRTAREIGFFYVTGHGVPDTVPEAVLAGSRRFFSLPEAEIPKAQAWYAKTFGGKAGRSAARSNCSRQSGRPRVNSQPGRL